ncbi:hypothetical protein BDD12DRAFT_363986 [Trichophaea hybrida]|nr:hypothetical protein BDD12DRAFT_363986 [Trichophaea hybrida]
MLLICMSVWLCALSLCILRCRENFFVLMGDVFFFLASMWYGTVSQFVRRPLFHFESSLRASGCGFPVIFCTFCPTVEKLFNDYHTKPETVIPAFRDPLARLL